ncbi:hypothetical protein Tco_1293076 [Tanacetum coccineum]
MEAVNTPYSVAQEIVEPNKVEREQLYSASANEIDEKKPELKILPQHLEYAYLHGDKSFPIIISSKLSEREKMLLLQVLEKRKGAIAWKISDIKGISLNIPNSDCTRRSRENNIHLSLWDLCLLMNAVWIMQHTNYFSKMLDGNFPRHGGRLYGSIHGRILGAENLVVDHLSRLENPDLGTFMEEEIADKFPDEHLMILKTKLNEDEPWYADYVNYIVGKIMPPN